MLDFSYPLLVLPLFLRLVLPIAIIVSVGGGMWIKNSNIKIRALESTSPETIGSYVKPCTFLSVGRGTGEHLTINRLEMWLYAHIITHFS